MAVRRTRSRDCRRNRSRHWRQAAERRRRRSSRDWRQAAEMQITLLDEDRAHRAANIWNDESWHHILHNNICTESYHLAAMADLL